jgi:hypothetical protein
MKKEQPTFWVTNISPRNVSLADLALTIKSYTTVNLLDNKHYSYTLDQLLKSKESGSLFKKGFVIKVRDVPPSEKAKEQMPIQREAIMPSRQRSILTIDEKEYDELKVSDEDQKKQEEIYAQENADLAEIDIQRSISVKSS